MLKKILQNFYTIGKIEDAIKKAEEYDTEYGIGYIVNYLGEHVKTFGEAYNNFEEFKKLIEFSQIKEISIKTTQFGKYTDLIIELMTFAKRNTVFVWLDMEDYDSKARILEIYKLLRNKGYNNVGITLQIYLKDTFADMQMILRRKGKIRLCRGAYNPPKELREATGRKDENEVFKHRIAWLFARSQVGFAIATHDKEIIEYTRRVARVSGTKVEFQFLMGKHKKLAKKLVSEGFCVKYYISFGKNVRPYLIRRFKKLFRIRR